MLNFAIFRSAEMGGLGGAPVSVAYCGHHDHQIPASNSDHSDHQHDCPFCSCALQSLIDGQSLKVPVPRDMRWHGYAITAILALRKLRADAPNARGPPTLFC